MNLKTIFTDPHTYLIAAMFIVTGWTAIVSQLPAGTVVTVISGIMSLITIYVHQTS